MGARENRFLTIQTGVDLTPTIEPVIVALDPLFEPLPRYVTSGRRNPESQLRLIRRYAISAGVAREFPEFATCTVSGVVRIELEGKEQELFGWQRTWSRLLNRGIIINPPVAATVLFYYIRNGINKKGRTIQPSPHFKGTAFDIGSGGTTVEAVEAIIKKAMAAGVRGLAGYVVEHDQGCVHVDCVAIVS